ncbi:hypothetical protein CDD80_6305 [Ophiocordyceps camponoti-rufipedis]|uniref:GH16 domain-containing protein n=1 Tax=Ophiocordyceps camponoti-rufipedis TaxID=2004952 RepID=A0A2C5ZH49_9HYPO|nr:hypothetical protein CDD80_6305 [Ophiocordyceps camponoti-rufipedis]
MAWILSLLFLLFALPFSRTGHALHLPKGFSRVLFRDDFSNSSTGKLPSAAKWSIAVGTSYPGGPAHWGTGEIQTYTKDESNIRVTDEGSLLITPTRQADGTWHSSRLETTAAWDFACRPGRRLRVEARIKLGDDAQKKQQGIWPAFWALGSAFRGHVWTWPSVGEVDIMESANGETEMRHALHCGFAPGGPCNEFSGINSVTQSVARGEWHVFSWEIDRRPGTGREVMTWIIDGVQRWTMDKSAVKSENAWKILVEGDKMLLLDVAVGGALPDALAQATTPSKATIGGRGAGMEVDYVAVYEGK